MNGISKAENLKLETKESTVSPAISPGISLVLTLWFVLVAVAFWGPYVVPPNQLTAFASICAALYGVFVLFVVARVALALLRRGGTEKVS